MDEFGKSPTNFISHRKHWVDLSLILMEEAKEFIDAMHMRLGDCGLVWLNEWMGAMMKRKWNWAGMMEGWKDVRISNFDFAEATANNRHGVVGTVWTVKGGHL